MYEFNILLCDIDISILTCDSEVGNTRNKGSNFKNDVIRPIFFIFLKFYTNLSLSEMLGKVIFWNYRTTLFFFIRDQFIRDMSLRFAEILRT